MALIASCSFYRFYRNTAMPTVYWLPVAAFVLQWQSQELQQRAYSLQSFKIFTVWPFEEKCANTLSEVRKCGLSLEAGKLALW